MTASGTAGYGTEFGDYLDFAVARRGRHQVARPVRVGRQPGPTAAPHGPGHDQRRRPPGPRSAVLARPRRRRPARHRGNRGRQHLGSIGRRLRAGGRPARRSAGGRRGRRSQPLVPEPRGARLDLRPRRRPVGRGDGSDRGMRPAALGQAQRQHRSDRRGRRSGGRCRRRGSHLHQHDARARLRPRDAARRRWVPAVAGCPGGPSIRWLFGPCTTCTRRSPTFRSSASGEWHPDGTPPS